MVTMVRFWEFDSLLNFLNVRVLAFEGFQDVEQDLHGRIAVVTL